MSSFLSNVYWFLGPSHQTRDTCSTNCIEGVLGLYSYLVYHHLSLDLLMKTIHKTIIKVGRGVRNDGLYLLHLGFKGLCLERRETKINILFVHLFSCVSLSIVHPLVSDSFSLFMCFSLCYSTFLASSCFFLCCVSTHVKEPSALIKREGVRPGVFLVWLAAYCTTAPCKALHGAMYKG